jgi:hypothetical protein
VVYVLFGAWAIISGLRVLRTSSRGKTLDPRARYVVVFIALGYLLWLTLFSIYRYVVPMELLTPFVAFVLLTKFASYLTAPADRRVDIERNNADRRLRRRRIMGP